MKNPKKKNLPDRKLNEIIENEEIGVELQDIPKLEEEKENQHKNKYNEVSQTFEFKAITSFTK